MHINTQTENNLTVTTLSADSRLILPTRTAINPNTYKYIHIKYKVLSGTPDFFQLFYYNTSITNALRSVVYFYNTTGTFTGGTSPSVVNYNNENVIINKWKYMTFDMSKDPLWTGGSWNAYRIDFTQATVGVQLQYEYLIISDSPNYPLSEPNGTADFNSDFTNVVKLNFGGLQNNYMGGSNIRRETTNLAGVVKVKQIAGETQQYAKPFNNPPIYLNGRPSSNTIEVDLLDMDMKTYNPTYADYLMNLYFEEI